MDGYLLRATRLLTEDESLIGTSPSDSLSVMSYRSSNSLLELRLLNSELPSDCVSELVGETATSSMGAESRFALGVGKLSLSGDVNAVRCRPCGGALRTEIWGVSSIKVLRSCARCALNVDDGSVKEAIF